MKILATLLVTIAFALPAAAQYDETAKSFHLLPHLADGGGWQSVLLVANVSQSASRCTFNVYGVPLNRFGEFSGVTAAGSTATFQLEGDGGYLFWPTKNELAAVASGYATLDCSSPCRCTSRVCVVRRVGGEGGGHSIQRTSRNGLPVSGSAASGHTRICDRKQYQRRGLLPHCP